MSKLYILILVLSISQISFSQTFSGTVYGKTSTLEGVIVKNLRTNLVTTTDNTGRFAIGAVVKDSLLFRFFTHEDQIIVLKDQDSSNFVVELIPEVNMLDEVFLEGPARFSEKRFVTKFKSDLATDIALHPEKYSYSNNPNGNLDLVNIGRELWKVIKKDKPVEKPKWTPIARIKHEQYFALFKVDAIINDAFLVETLHIPITSKVRFIDYCISKRLAVSLLQEKNKFYLIDELIKMSEGFAELEVGE